MKKSYFKKSIEELCIEEAELLRLAWNDWVRRENKRLEEELNA